MVGFLGIPDWFWHPLRIGDGYNFWSGFGSDLGELTLVAGIVSLVLMAWHHFDCHADGCPRLTWHVHADHGHPVCKRHHPDGGNAPHTVGGQPANLPLKV